MTSLRARRAAQGRPIVSFNVAKEVWAEFCALAKSAGMTRSDFLAFLLSQRPEANYLPPEPTVVPDDELLDDDTVARHIKAPAPAFPGIRRGLEATWANLEATLGHPCELRTARTITPPKMWAATLMRRQRANAAQVREVQQG